MKQLFSPKDLARVTGVSESSLKLLADSGRLECTRTAGGHRRIPLAEAVRFIRESSISVVDPSMLGITSRKVGRPRASRSRTSTSAKWSCRAAKKRPSATSPTSTSPATALPACVTAPFGTASSRSATPGLKPLTAKRRIFALLKSTVPVDIILQALQQLRRMVQSPRPLRSRLVAPPGDPYLCLYLCAALSLLGDGWRRRTWGQGSLFEVLRTAAVRAKAKLVWVSISVESPEANIRQGLEMLSETMLGMNGSVVVGGRKAAQEADSGHSWSACRHNHARKWFFSRVAFASRTPEFSPLAINSS